MLGPFVSLAAAAPSSLPSWEDLLLFADLDQANKLIWSSRTSASSSSSSSSVKLSPDPLQHPQQLQPLPTAVEDMYPHHHPHAHHQSLQPGGPYDSPAPGGGGGGFGPPSAGSPVYVPTTRVGSMLSYLPSAGGVIGQGGGPSAWASQAPPDSPAASSPYGAGGGGGCAHPVPTGRFAYPAPSPPGPNGAAREAAAYSPREQFRPLNGSYYGPYTVGAPLGPPGWPAGAFDNSVLHCLPSRAAPLAVRPPNAGKRRSAELPLCRATGKGTGQKKPQALSKVRYLPSPRGRGALSIGLNRLKPGGRGRD